MRGILFVFFSIILFSIPAFPQYATTGNGALKNEIWWFNWAGLNIANGEARNFNTTDGLTVRISLSNVTGNLRPDVMNTWSGAMLHYLYDFTDPAIKPTMHSPAISYNNCSVTLTIEVKRGNTLVPFTIVASDGEGSSPDEWTYLTTTGSPWQTIEYYRSSNDPIDPLVGCNTKQVRIYYTSDVSNRGGRNPLLVSNSSDGKMTLDVLFDRHVPGGMAMAFGIMAPIDRGDLPASYGTAQHQLYYDVIDACNYLPPFPSIVLAQPLFIGTVPGDADGYQTSNDNTNGVDEDGVSVFPKYDNSGTYTLPVTVTNQTGQDAYLSGYFDLNRNGQFDNGEEAHAVVPHNASSATLSWTGLPVWLPTGSSAGYGFRFRISSDPASARSATGVAVDGEVEDYFIPSDDLCSIQVRSVNDTTVCPGKPVQLTTTGGITYSWNKPDYLDNTTIAAPVAKAEQAMEYIVTGSNPQGCVAKDTVYIDMLPVPSISTSGDITICNGSSAPLLATAPGAVRFSWQPALGLDDPLVNNPVASPGTDTEYAVQAEGSNGCVSSSKLKVMYWPLPSFSAAAARSEICLKDKLALKASGADQYTWLSANNAVLGNTPEIEVEPDVSQVYRVEMRSLRCGESDIISIPVTVNQLPQTSVLKSNDIDCKNGQATLYARGGTAYRWDPLPGISTYESASPVVTPTTTTKYYVSVYSSKGCVTRDSATVEVDLKKNLSKYPVPSAFTPNNDGNNDCFGLKGWGRTTALEFCVFNRWGQVLFKTADPSACWDGRFNGVPQPSGGYIYQIKATTLCGTAYRKGIVMLIR